MSHFSLALSAAAAIAAAFQGFFLWQTLEETRQGSMRQLIVDGCAQYLSAATEAHRANNSVIPSSPYSPLDAIGPVRDLDEQWRNSIRVQWLGEAQEERERARLAYQRLLLFSEGETTDSIGSAQSALLQLVMLTTYVENISGSQVEAVNAHFAEQIEIVRRNCVEVARGGRPALR